MKNKIVSIILALSILLSLAVPVSATQELFISEVALIYKDSVEEAEKAIEGTDWKLFEKDLNPDADLLFDDGVFLIYKTSTNVEDAITDLRVMDMYGGYSISDYRHQLKQSRKEYLSIIDELNIAIDEFKELYKAGDKMAILAHRQMNYYKDVGETDLLMGDFLLNVPSENAFVTVMMEGNSYVFSNLVLLLVVGLSGASDQTLATRIAEKYADKDSLTNQTYYEDAAVLSEQFEEIRDTLIRFESLSESYNLDDQALDEEEFQFMYKYGSMATALDGISYGDGSLKDFILAGEWTVPDLYPIVASLTAGQMALIGLGQFPLILQYSSPSKPIDELFAIVEELEKDMMDEEGNIKPFDVYTGVDRSIFKGALAFTTAADRQQALTGQTWSVMDNFEDYLPTTANIILLATSATVVMTPVLAALVGEFIIKPMLRHALLVESPLWYPLGKVIDFIQTKICMNKMVFTKVSFGFLLIAAGITTINILYDYYNPDYTTIPDTLIDIRETDLGDRYIKYTAAKVFGEDGKNADFNAYQGKEWIALYYTKDASAGNCLTPNFVYRVNNSTVSRRHQGVSMFGETDAFDLNSHVYNDDVDGIYLSVRYSMTTKAAEELPQVVASLFSTGTYYAISALAGICIGAVAMTVIFKAKKNKGSDTSAPQPDSDK